MKHTTQQAVLIARVSSREQEIDGYSLPAQEKLLREYAERKVFSIKKLFTISESASKSDQRKIFQEAMAYVAKHQVKVLVVEKVDRLVRNFRDTLMIDDWLEEDEERQVHFVKDSLILHKNARSQEKLNWGMRVVIAKNYIDNLKEEVEKGVKEKLAQGWLPGVPPLGYKTIGEEGKKIHVIDEETRPLIIKLFELYLDPSHSLSSVTAEMKRIGLRTRKGRPLSISHITKLLKHKFYIGMIPWNGQVYPSGKHEVFISEELFDAVQAKIAGKNIPKQTKHNPTFKSMFKCAECNGTITWERQKGHWYGHCNRYRGCPKKVWAREDEIEEQLVDHFDKLAAPSPALIEWVKDELRDRHATDMEAHYATQRRLKHRHEDIARRIDIAYEDRLDGRLSVHKYDLLVEKYNDEQATIKKELDRYDETYMARLEYNLNILDLSQKAAVIYESKKQPEERRQLLGQIFSNLTLDGKLLDYEYTETAAAIAKVAAETNDLKNTFELDNNGLPKEKEEFLAASKTIWLGR